MAGLTSRTLRSSIAEFSIDGEGGGGGVRVCGDAVLRAFFILTRGIAVSKH